MKGFWVPQKPRTCRMEGVCEQLWSVAWISQQPQAGLWFLFNSYANLFFWLCFLAERLPHEREQMGQYISVETSLTSRLNKWTSLQVQEGCDRWIEIYCQIVPLIADAEPSTLRDWVASFWDRLSYTLTLRLKVDIVGGARLRFNLCDHRLDN